MNNRWPTSWNPSGWWISSLISGSGCSSATDIRGGRSVRVNCCICATTLFSGRTTASSWTLESGNHGTSHHTTLPSMLEFSGNPPGVIFGTSGGGETIPWGYRREECSVMLITDSRSSRRYKFHHCPTIVRLGRNIFSKNPSTWLTPRLTTLLPWYK